MPALTPTVHERLARCGTEVLVTGLVAGAEVTLSVDGATFSHTATGGGHVFAVPSLDAGARVRARQDDGTGPTPDSPAVEVEDAAVPPVAAPLLPSQVGSCSQCVHVTGMVPGCEVEVLQGSAVVGSARAGRNGTACVGVRLRTGGPEIDDVGSGLAARMIVCGATGPSAATALVSEAPLPVPLVGGPLFGCQRVVPLHGLRPGARGALETDSGTFLGSFCSCWEAVNVFVAHALVTGERVRAWQYWDQDPCKDEGGRSGWRDVEAPDERIRPTVQEALVSGDQVIRVTGQVPGADLVVLVRDDPAATAVRYGPRPAGEEPEIALNEPLQAGWQVAVEQRLCGRVEVSEWVTVLPAPAVVAAPVVVPPLYECAGAVQVVAVHPGAVVRIFQDGVPCGLAWAGSATSVAVAAAPALVAGAEVTARQWVGGTAGPFSDPVGVQALEELHPPRIVPPVALGDTTVWVSGVTPGALVSVRTVGGVLLGERHAPEPLVPVGVSPVPGAVRPSVRLCDRSRTGDRAVPLDANPCATGPEAGVGEQDRVYEAVTVPVRPVPGAPDDGGFTHPVQGRLYFPATADGELPDGVRDRPVVVVLHGYWDCDEQDQSHLGYAYLARHLARWGAFVFSLDLAKVNDETRQVSGQIAAQQWSRGEVALAAVDRLLADPTLRGRIDRDRVGLVGHSMGGEGVVAAQVLNLSRPAPYGIRGVVSFAPTQYRPDLALTETRYLQLHGSRDYLVGEATGANPRFGGFRIYDRAWRPRTHVWAHGARHQGWNPNWWTGTGSPCFHEGDSPPLPGDLTLDQHADVARCVVNAFFQDALFGRTGHAGYLEGLVRPPSLAGLDLFFQHQSPAAEVIDDFGDADGQLGLPEETPPDKAVNRTGGAVAATGAGLDRWEDVEHVTLDHSVHDTRGSDVAWSAPDVVYRTEFPPVAATGTGYLSVRVAQHYEEDGAGEPVETHNPVGVDLDLLVELGDGATSAVVRLASTGVVPYPAPGPEVLSVFRTARLPLDAFTAAGPGLQLGALRQVTLRLAGRTSGRVLVDDVEVVP